MKCESQAAFEASAAVGIGAVEDRHDRVGRTDALNIDPEDRLGIKALQMLDLFLREKHRMTGDGQGVGEARFQARSAWVKRGPAR